MNQDSIKKLIEIMEQTEEKIKKESNKEVVNYYNDTIEGISEALIWEGVCPECGEDLITKGTSEFRGECHGVPSFEDIETYVCKNGHSFD